MAEREGFEPSVRVSLYGGLANRWIKPLSHLSIVFMRMHAPHDLNVLLKYETYMGLARNFYFTTIIFFVFTKLFVSIR